MDRYFPKETLMGKVREMVISEDGQVVMFLDCWNWLEFSSLNSTIFSSLHLKYYFITEIRQQFWQIVVCVWTIFHFCQFSNISQHIPFSMALWCPQSSGPWLILKTIGFFLDTYGLNSSFSVSWCLLEVLCSITYLYNRRDRDSLRPRNHVSTPYSSIVFDRHKG